MLLLKPGPRTVDTQRFKGFQATVLFVSPKKKNQESSGLLILSRGIRRTHWSKMGQMEEYLCLHKYLNRNRILEKKKNQISYNKHSNIPYGIKI